MSFIDVGIVRFYRSKRRKSKTDNRIPAILTERINKDLPLNQHNSLALCLYIISNKSINFI